MVQSWDEEHMKTLSAREMKYNFEQLIDTTHTVPVVVEKHERLILVALSVGGYERLNAIKIQKAAA
jgi:hypothetical protein